MSNGRFKPLRDHFIRLLGYLISTIFERLKSLNMLSVVGTYENGHLKLDKDYVTKNPVKVIVTFLEAIESTSEKGLNLTDFSFAKSKKNLQSFKGSFADMVIVERVRGFITHL